MTTLAGRRPHVVLASRIFLPEAAAASFRLGELALALRDAGADVTVLTTTVPGSSEPDLPGIDVRRLPVHRDRDGYVRGYVNYLSFDIPLAFRLLGVRKPDVIVCEPPPTTGAVTRVASALRRVPYVYFAPDIWSDAAESTDAPDFVVRVLRSVERRAMRSANAVLSVSEGITGRLSDWGLSDGVTTVGNGIDTSQFGLEGNRKVLDGPYLVYAGTASEFQGATIFTEAFGRLLDDMPDARLVFLGQGSDFPQIERAAAALPKGRVLVLGRQPPETAAAWLRGASASLVSIRSGIGYDFALPTKMYASAACGTRVIFAGPGPSRTLIEDNALGWATDYDPDQVTAAMRSALSDAPSDGDRIRLAEWAIQNASLRAAAQRASSVVIAVAQGAPSGEPGGERRA